jgi:LPS export ABC transporter protein LptC
MKFKKSNLIIAAIVVIGLLIIGLAFIWPQPAPKTPPPDKKIKTVRQTQNLLMGMEIKIPGAEPESYWNLKVDQFTEQNKVGTMIGIKGDYFLNDKPLYHVSARSGEINWQTRLLRFRQKVEFSSMDGKRLIAREFLWDPVQKRVTAEREVVLSAPGFRIYSQKVSANLKMERVTFSGATRMVRQ